VGVKQLKAAVNVRCYGDSLLAGKSSWQVDYRVSLYCHEGWNSVYVTRNVLLVSYVRTMWENAIDEVIDAAILV
jgi:hypothetical protein